MILALLLYRMNPRRARCPRQGPSCSQLALSAARQGQGLAEILAIPASCGCRWD